MKNSSFQLELLHGPKAAAFTPAGLKESRKVFKEIREFLLNPDPEIQPLRVPYFDVTEERIFFLAMVGDDEALAKSAIFVQYMEKGVPMVGLGLKQDEAMWLGEEGRAHLETDEVKTFRVGPYVAKKMKEYFND